MNSFTKKIIDLLSKDLRCDAFTNDLANAIGLWLNKFKECVAKMKNNFFFDTLTAEGCDFFDELLEIEKTTNDIDDRRARIKAKWISNVHNSLDLIQACCDAWKNGETEVSFKGGLIKIVFIGAFGVPKDLDALLELIEKIKPAHIGYNFEFKYLLKKQIHNIMLKSEMETITKVYYCNVATVIL